MFQHLSKICLHTGIEMKNNTEIIPELNLNSNHTRTHFNFNSHFHLLLAKLPNTNRSSNYKKNNSKDRHKSSKSLTIHKFIEYNSRNSVSLIMLDFDKFSPDRTMREQFHSPQHFWDHFLSDYLDSCNFITMTDKGFQVIITFEHRLNRKYKKSWYLYQKVKEGMVRDIPYIDKIASGRAYGLMRNPLLHEYIVIEEHALNLQDFEEFGRTPILAPIEHRKVDKFTQRSEVKTMMASILDERDVIVEEGMRKTVLFQLGMINAKTSDNHFEYLDNINETYVDEPLPESELDDLVRSITKYKAERKLFIGDPRSAGKSKRARKRQNKRAYKKSRKGKRRQSGLLSSIARKKLKRTKKVITKYINLKDTSWLRFSSGKFNLSAIARATGLNIKTVTRWMEVLVEKVNGESFVEYLVRISKGMTFSVWDPREEEIEIPF